jgi:hypothetical protein
MMIVAAILVLLGCARESHSPIATLYHFETATWATRGDLQGARETARWLYLDLHPNSSEVAQRLGRLERQTKVRVRIAGRLSAPVRVSDMLNAGALRVPRRDLGGEPFAPAFGRLMALTSNEARGMVDIGVATAITSFDQEDLIAVAPDAGMADFRLSAPIEWGFELLLTSNAEVLSSSAGIEINGDQLRASGIRRDVLERWAEAE